jgi:hypothetical protein
VLRPRMPRWFRPVWDWAGRADDVLGRLHVLRDAGTILAAAFVIVGVVLLNTVGAWGALAILAAIGFALFAIVDQVVSHRARTVARAASGSGETVAEQAAVLVAEMRSFYIEQREGLPPLELVLVGAPPNGLEQWQASRDAAIVVEFNRVFGDRLREIYEALRASRGYGHPLMEGRYDSIRSPGEIVTVARRGRLGRKPRDSCREARREPRVGTTTIGRGRAARASEA